jgi:parvulin-like peptidyl-prolyl isomerase
MSIMRMRKMFHRQRHVKVGKKRFTLPSVMAIVFSLLVVIFIIGAFWSFGGPGGRGGGGRGSTAPTGEGGSATLSANVATVNGQPISRLEFLTALERQSENPMMGGAMGVSQIFGLKGQVLDDLVSQALQLQAVRNEKVSVSGAELKKEISDQVEQSIAAQWPTQEDLFKYLQSNNISRDQLVERLTKRQSEDVEGLRQRLELRKLQEKIEGAVQVNDQTVKDFYSEVHVDHILISPEALIQKSIKQPAPASGAAAATPAAPAEPTLTPEQADAQAKQKADQLLAELQKGGDFAALAKANSDDPGSAVKGGDLGWVPHGKTVPEFEQAAFALQPGQLSAVVKSQFGYHIIKLLERKSTLPADFDKNKAKYEKEAGDQLQQQAWQNYQQKLHDEAQIVILDPELKALQVLQKGDFEAGKALLAEAARQDPDNTTARWALAQLAAKEENWPVAIQYMEEVSKSQKTATDPTVWMQLAEMKAKAGDKPGSLEAYKSASDRASAPDMMNYQVHLQLKDKFKELGQPDLVAQEDKWLADFEAQQKQKQEEMGGAGGGAGPGGTIQIPPPSG